MEEGMYRFKLTITNPDQRSSSDEVMVAVTSTQNIVPTISLSSPTNNATHKEGEEITISASANDFDGTIQQVDFYQNDQLINSDNTAPYSIQWTAAVGEYAITAKAIDDGGAVGVSQAVNVTFLSVLFL